MRRHLLWLLLAGFLSACAGDQTGEQATWSKRTLYPPEACWSVYAKRNTSAPDYWRIRRWCDRRETRSDPFI